MVRGTPPPFRGGACLVSRALPVILVLAVALAVTSLIAPVSAQVRSGSGGSSPLAVGWVDPTAANTSSTDAGLCPAGGPVILGIEWNCVAVLDLTELALFLVSIGIIAYVFRDADQAELPGDSTEVPVTAEEEAAYRTSREQGVPYQPPEPEREEGSD